MSKLVAVTYSDTPIQAVAKVSPAELRITEAIKNPDLFAEYFLGSELWPTQRAIMQAVKTCPKIAVKACHSSSKTYTAARVALWFLACYQDAVVVTTAPTWGQVEKQMWGEIHSALLKSKYPFPEANQTLLRLAPKRYAYGLATSVTKQDEGVKFQGIHADNVLVIVDEAPGVDAKLWEAIEGARAGGNVRVLALGNPTIASGPFYNAFTAKRGHSYSSDANFIPESDSGWTCFTIDAFDTPNLQGITLDQLLQMSSEELDKDVTPYLTRRRWVKEMYYEWGPGHPSWESRVRGNFPKQSPDSLFSLTWLEEAAIRTVPEGEEVVAGVDVAGPGEDETSVTIRAGNMIIYHNQWTSTDPRGDVALALNPYKSKLKAVNVDCIGIGWNFYLHLKDLGFQANPVNVCEASSDSDKYADQKTEFYWGLRQRFQLGQIGGLTDAKTIGQLAGIRYKPTPRGQIKVESKDEMSKRGVKSPDRAESIMLAFADKILVYGVMEFYKKMQMDKIQESKLVKPYTADNQLTCPDCLAVCVVVCGNGWRCNQCGRQWSTTIKDSMPVPGRKDALQKGANKYGLNPSRSIDFKS